MLVLCIGLMRNFTQGSKTRGTNKGGISFKELRLEVPRMAALEYYGGN
jgi:hypothetical protein